MVLFPVIWFFFLLQTATTTTSEILPLDDPGVTQLLATQYICPEQNNLRQFSLTRVQESTQVTSEIEETINFASAFIRPKGKKIEAFGCSATIKKSRVFCAQVTLDK